MQITNLEELLQALGAKKIFKADGTLTKQADKAYDKLVNILAFGTTQGFVENTSGHSRAQRAEKEFIMDKELQQAINDAIEVAKTGTTEEKQDFVSWACTAINYYSSQFDEESKQALQNVMAQYKAYLEALNN